LRLDVEVKVWQLEGCEWGQETLWVLQISQSHLAPSSLQFSHSRTQFRVLFSASEKFKFLSDFKKEYVFESTAIGNILPV
jgi:hypothetical protein